MIYKNDIINEEVIRIKSLMNLISEEIILEGVLDKLITKFIEKQVIKNVLNETERNLLFNFLRKTSKELTELEIKEISNLMKSDKGEKILTELKNLVSDATLPQEKASLNSKITKLEKYKELTPKLESGVTTDNFLNNLLSDLESNMNTLDYDGVKNRLKKDMDKLGVELKVPKGKIDLLFEDLIKKMESSLSKVSVEGDKIFEEILKNWDRYTNTEKKKILDNFIGEFNKVFANSSKEIESKLKIPGIGNKIQKFMDGWTTHWFTKYFMGGSMVKGKGLMRGFTFYLSTLVMTTIYSVFSEILWLGTKKDDNRTVLQKFQDWTGSLSSEGIAEEVIGKYFVPVFNVLTNLINLLKNVSLFFYSRIVKPIQIGKTDNKKEKSLFDKGELELEKRSILSNAPNFPYLDSLSTISGQTYLTYDKKRYPVLKNKQKDFYIKDPEVGEILLKDMQ